MSKRLTHKEQVEAIQKKNPNIEVLGEITGNKTKVLCRCKVCSHEWEVEPYRLKRGDGCPECTRLKRTLTHEEQIAAISEANPDVKVLEEITGDKIKVLCLCKICGHRWPARPYSLKAGRGCPKCGDPALSHEEQIAAIAAINPDVEVVGRVIKDNKRVLCRCKICNHKWKPRPNDLKRGSRCPECSRKERTLTHEEQVVAISKVNPDLEILEEITRSDKKVLCRCKICGHEWPTNPHKLKLGRGCPKCADHGFLSHEQGHLYIMVDDLEIPTVMKVGVSIDAEARRDRVFKSAKKAGVGISDLHVVKTWKGSTDDMHALEKAMHQALSQYKVNFTEKFDGCQEFFYYRPEVFELIEEHLKKLSKQ